MCRHIKFNFSVNSEKGKDGLSFYIDTMEQPIMGLQSYEVSPTLLPGPGLPSAFAVMGALRQSPSWASKFHEHQMSPPRWVVAKGFRVQG